MSIWSDIPPARCREAADWYWVRNRQSGEERMLFYHGWNWQIDDAIVASHVFLLEYQIGPRVPSATEIVESAAKVLKWSWLDHGQFVDPVIGMLCGQAVREANTYAMHVATSKSLRAELAQSDISQQTGR